nr:Os03g0183850 [Ipomoea batatas]
MTRAIEDHISVTLLPEQVTPFQDSPHGSPPFAVHFVSCCGEFRLENNPLRTDAGNAKKQVPVGSVSATAEGGELSRIPMRSATAQGSPTIDTSALIFKLAQSVPTREQKALSELPNFVKYYLLLTPSGLKKIYL